MIGEPDPVAEQSPVGERARRVDRDDPCGPVETANVPQSWIVGVQLYRVLGVIFLVLYASGKIPGAFALPAGIGDVLTGLLAPIVALGYARGRPGAERRVLAWNVFGLLDLVVAVMSRH